MPRVSVVVALVLGGVLVVSHPASAQGQRRGFGRAEDGTPGRRAIRVDAPGAESLAGQAAVDALRGEIGQKVRARGGDPEEIVTLVEADPSVRVGLDGQVVFLDAADPALASLAAADISSTLAATGPAPVPTALAANGLPLHHSRPGAPWTIYIDVESRRVPVNATMRAMLNLRVGEIATTGLTLDADGTTFIVEEQELVSRIWGRVAEDWAPFDVDVTTERPASFATSPWGGPRVIWNLVTRSETVVGFPFGSLYGIAAAPGICSVSTNFDGQPTFTFWGTIGSRNHSDIADTISHEAGHVVGLVHDGLTTGAQYYSGHGTGPTSWGPIMGGPIDRNVTQWSKGEYPNASNFNVCGPLPQDDVLHITRTFGPRADEASDALVDAALLSAPTRGVIAAQTDTDVFALPRADDVRIRITPFRAGEQTDGGNLDVAAEIVNAAGLVVARADDVTQTTAEIAALLPPGQHYLRVEASADPAHYSTYGSIGQYTVTGTFISNVKMSALASPLPADALTPGQAVPLKFTLTDTVNAARVQLWSEESSATAIVLAEATCRAQRGVRQHCTLKLPKSLVSGQRYWLVAQIETTPGAWTTAQVESGATFTNPLPFMAR